MLKDEKEITLESKNNKEYSAEEIYRKVKRTNVFLFTLIVIATLLLLFIVFITT